MQFFPHISIATTFLGTSLIIEKKNCIEYARKCSFCAVTSPNIPGLAIVLCKTFPFLRAEQVLLSNHYPVRLYMECYSTEMLVKLRLIRTIARIYHQVDN